MPMQFIVLRKRKEINIHKANVLISCECNFSNNFVASLVYLKLYLLYFTMSNYLFVFKSVLSRPVTLKKVVWRVLSPYQSIIFRRPLFLYIWLLQVKLSKEYWYMDNNYFFSKHQFSKHYFESIISFYKRLRKISSWLSAFICSIG